MVKVVNYLIMIERQHGDSEDNPHYFVRNIRNYEALEKDRKNWRKVVHKNLDSMRKKGEKNLKIEDKILVNDSFVEYSLSESN
jgi:hypothetical protein